MNQGGKASIETGLFVSAMVTAALLAVVYFAWRVIGLPFVPFDVFDWLTRVLPGPVIAFGISTMVSVIRALNLGPTATAAKLAEQSMAVINLFLIGLIVGTVLFQAIRAVHGRKAHILGLAFGFLLGLPMALVGHPTGQSASLGAGVNAVWVLGGFLVWGVVIARAGRRLVDKGEPVAGEEASVQAVDRRRFLVRLGGSTAVITVVGAVVGELAETRRRQMMAEAAVGRWSATHPLPNADAAVKPAPGTRPEFTALERHYRIDINTSSPAIDEQQWRLKISGLVAKPQSLTLAELRRHEPMHQFVTLSCISNPVGGDLIGTTRWTGVSLQRFLPELGLQPQASHLKLRAADGFWEIVSLEAIRADKRVMLAYEWDGVPLTREHGFPLRIYIPDVHGMKQPKWIESIEVIDHWEPGYWVQRGWDKVAQMKSTAVIDIVSVDMTIIHADSRKLVPIGGIAHAGARGISKVEVQLDEGPWQAATLRTPLSETTWVMWRYDWPFQAGKHTFTVRCFDGKGTPQITTPSPPEPSGASGLHSKTQMF